MKLEERPRPPRGGPGSKFEAQTSGWRSLASMTSIRSTVICRSDVDWPGCYVDRRDVNWRRWRVIDRRWWSDIHRLRRKSAADNGSNAEAKQACTYGRTIAGFG